MCTENKHQYYSQTGVLTQRSKMYFKGDYKASIS